MSIYSWARPDLNTGSKIYRSHLREYGDSIDEMLITLDSKGPHLIQVYLLGEFLYPNDTFRATLQEILDLFDSDAQQKDFLLTVL